MVIKSDKEIREIIFRAMSQTALKTYLISEGRKLSDLTESVNTFVSDRCIIHILTKEGKLSDLEIHLLTKNFIINLCSCEALQGSTFGGLKEIFSDKFWREIHSQCIGTSYEYSFSFTNDVPKVVIKDKGKNTILQVEGFLYIGELMKSLIDDIDELMLDDPHESVKMDIWCYDALDYHSSTKQIKTETIYINLSERLMLIELVNKSLLDACRYRPDKEDREKRFVNKQQKKTKPKPQTPSVEVLQEADNDGFVMV